MYGFTGATIGKMPCLEISSSTTSYGRGMIEHTKCVLLVKVSAHSGLKEAMHPALRQSPTCQDLTSKL